MAANKKKGRKANVIFVNIAGGVFANVTPLRLEVSRELWLVHVAASNGNTSKPQLHLVEIFEISPLLCETLRWKRSWVLSLYLLLLNVHHGVVNGDKNVLRIHAVH